VPIAVRGWSLVSQRRVLNTFFWGSEKNDSIRRCRRRHRLGPSPRPNLSRVTVNARNRNCEPRSVWITVPSGSRRVAALWIAETASCAVMRSLIE